MADKRIEERVQQIAGHRTVASLWADSCNSIGDGTIQLRS
jgi:hypothetical protein